jgi:hypothetical protein
MSLFSGGVGVGAGELGEGAARSGALATDGTIRAALLSFPFSLSSPGGVAEIRIIGGGCPLPARGCVIQMPPRISTERPAARDDRG